MTTTQSMPAVVSEAAAQKLASGKHRKLAPEPGSESFLRRHAVFLTVLSVASLVRVITMLAYFPAFWHADSFGYVGGSEFQGYVLAPALAPYPMVVRPVGYSLMVLWPLRIFHSAALVTGVQALLGLLAGVMIYVLLRHRFRFADWTATLATAPVLLSAYELQLEHYMLSDTLFMFLTVAALCVALWKRVPIWSFLIIGLLLGAAAITRTEGLPLLAPFAVAVVMSFAGKTRRALCILALVAGFVLPVGAYAAWFKDVHGTFELESTYGGAFTAARVEPFANCSVIKPPASERWLCLNTPLSHRLAPDGYLWGGPPSPLAVPGSVLFNRVDSAEAEKFAIHAIEHQPLAYISSVASMFTQTFKNGPTTDGQASWMFPASQPQAVQQLAAENPGTSATPFYQYNGGHDPSTQFSQPWVNILRVYQDVMVIPPPLLGGIAVIGLLGVCLTFRRKHGGKAFLPWLAGITLLLVPAMTSSYEARYVVAAVPFLCVAAALAARDIARSNERDGYRVLVGMILAVITLALYELQDTVWHLNQAPKAGLAHEAWSWGSLVWLGAVLPGICGMIGMVTWRPPRGLDQVQAIPQLVSWRVVSRGLNKDALRLTITRIRTEMALTPLFPYVIEVVTDEEPYGLPAAGPGLRYLVPPRGYRTANGSLYKARALQYAIEHSAVPSTTWIVHLDEETRPTRSGIQGIARMIAEEEKSGELRIGQGGILYHRNLRSHPFLTLADSIRTGDDLARFHFAYRVLGRPLFGFHGSFIVVRSDVERQAGFDFGPVGSQTEDAFWAVVQAQLGRRCRWVEGYLEEQSTHSALDFIKQRRRWFQGLVKVSLYAPVKLRHRAGILINTAMWALAPVSVLYTVAHLFVPGYVEPWVRALANLSLSSFAVLYVVGLAINMAQRRVAWPQRVLLMAAQVLLLPVFTALEGISVTFGLISKDNGFHVVKK